MIKRNYVYNETNHREVQETYLIKDTAGFPFSICSQQENLSVVLFFFFTFYNIFTLSNLHVVKST